MLDLTLSSPGFDEGGTQLTEQQVTYSLIYPFRPRNLMTEADIGMTEHRSKNTLG